MVYICLKIIDMKIGKVIKKLRKKANQKQSDLANGIGSTQPYISMIERGRVTPSAVMLQSIANHFNVEYVNLLLMAR